MKSIQLLVFSAIFGLFAIVGDQSAFQIEKKIYVINEEIDDLNENLDKNISAFDFYSLNHKMILHGLNHAYSLKYLDHIKKEVNSNFLQLNKQLSMEVKERNFLHSFNFFKYENKKYLNFNKMLDLTAFESWQVLSLLSDVCLTYSNKQMCNGLNKLIADQKNKVGKVTKLQEIELNIYSIDFALAAFKYGQRDILEAKLKLISKVKSLTYWRQISLVTSVGGSIISIIFILLYFRRHFINKI